MRDARHTPGPWKMTTDSSGQQIEIAGPRKSERIAEMVRTDTAIGQSNEVYANARIIAESPEMYELCHLAAQVIDDDLEGRAPRHSLGRLHARLCAVLNRIETT